MARTGQSYRLSVQKKYNEMDGIWDDSDRWHAWSNRQIASEIANITLDKKFDANRRGLVIDVGSGGYSYALSETHRIDVDLAEARLTKCKLGVCANAEMLPLRSEVSDLTICVGPVINYCSAEEVISELSRISRKLGYLVLHVELSNSFEFLGKKPYMADADFVKTFYKGDEHIWVYSDNYIKRILFANNFSVERASYFHILSSAVFRLTRNANLSAKFAPADRVLSKIRGVGAIADSAIYVCRKTF